MTQQVQQFATVQGNITQLLGQDKSVEFIAESLFFISVGNNDILDHHRSKRTTVSQTQLMEAIRSNFTVQLTNLYNLGARKFGIISVPPLGCCPAARVENKTERSGCLTELNDYARAFYSTVSALLPSLSSQLHGMIYSLGDAYNMTFTTMKDPKAFGFKNIEEACCGKGYLNGEKPCFIYYSPNLCLNRTEYLFWDLYHPTEFASKLAALTLFSGNSSFVVPINFSQLARASP
ncbi:GDSL esterase/lipase At4g16230-like [Syzygium oleosum]|uniref:GDSL esterase/lipase At4g16230-like n=1 Tax=Syzygium oleosum TaxID=219896 RepID=UPI0024BAFB2B|nr:GDSL esterase/lipase At4g16230-like [Syzygium oleosum]